MDILNFISLIICAMAGAVVIYLYLKARHILKINSDETLEKVMPEFTALMNKMTVAVYCLAGVFVIRVIIHIIDMIF